MRRAVSALIGVSILGLAVGVAAADLSGKWQMTSKTPRGDRTQEITLAQDGEKLTVTTKGRDGTDLVSEGSVKGEDVTWTVKRQTPAGEMVMTYKGKVAGKTMSGTAERGAGGTIEWKAEKIEK